MFTPKEHIINLERNPNKPKRLYLEVKWRLIWLNNDHPVPPGSQISISTDIVQLTDSFAAIKATVSVANDSNGAKFNIVRQGVAQCSKEQFPDFLEKAETAAIGRALLTLGYGTQWAMEYDEGIEDLGNGKRAKLADTPVEPVEPVDLGDVRIDHKAYADEVSAKAEWRTRCFDLAKHIAKQNKVECGQEAFDEAFRQYENVAIEEANIERLTEWLAHLSTPKGSQYILDFCHNFNAKLDQELLAEDQKAEWQQKCVEKAKELGYSIELHHQAYFRRASHKFEEATTEQLEMWHTFLEAYGAEYLLKISTPEQPEQPEQPDELQLRRVCASIRMLWAKLPDYNNLKHKANSIKQHIGNYLPGELSECNNFAKLQEYENYLKEQLKRRNTNGN